MTPIVNGVKGHYRWQLDVIYADLDQQAGKDLAQKHNVRAYPVIILLDREGNEVKRLQGVISRAPLEEVIDLFLAEQ